MSFAWLILVAIGLASFIRVAASEIIQEEAKTRLAHLPATLIRLAVTRLPKEARDDTAAEWLAELDSVLRDTDGLPLTRLLVGTRYAMGLLWAAGGIARELTEEESAIAVETSADDLIPDLIISPSGLVGYRGPTACAAAGITYRQLDYWARTGLIEPSVRSAVQVSSSRLYSPRDILMLKLVKRLLDTGISLQQIRAAVNHIGSRNIADLTGVTLMSDGRSVYECISPDEVVDLLCGGQGIFGIALTRLWQEVCRELTELPSVDLESGRIRPISPRELPGNGDYEK